MGSANKKNHSTTANGSKNHSMTRCQNCQNHTATANGSSPQNCQNHARTYHGMLLEQKMAAKFRGNDGKIMSRSKQDSTIECD